MKQLKLWITFVLPLVFGANVVLAQTAPGATSTGRTTTVAATPARAATGIPAGQVQAFIVQGDVKIQNSKGVITPLAKGQTFQEGSTVLAGTDGMALLVFSNGATMRVTPNAQLEVTKFKQAKFDEQAEGGTFLRLTRDPSMSETDLFLNNGTLQGEVKTLNRAAGSSFVVNTPAGSAGIRGTIVSITVVRDATGRVTSVIANCVIGGLGFTPKTGAPANSTNGETATGNQTGDQQIDVNEGGQVQITLTVNEAGEINGFSASGAGLSTASSSQLLTEVYGVVNEARTTEGIPVAPPPAAPPPALPTSTTLTVTPTGEQPITITTNPAPTPPAPGTPTPVTGTITQPPTPNTNPSNKASGE